MENKRVLSFPLRLSLSVRQQAAELAREEGISLNHFISLAVAEKISRLEHDTWLQQQGKTASARPPLARAPLYKRV
jgi:post-segregation antitoxin (ccd killing protein)